MAMVFVQRDGSHASALAYTPTSSPTITQHTASTRYLPLRVRFASGLKRESVVHQRAWVHVLMGQGRRVYDTDTQQIVSLIMKIRGAQALKIREA